MPCQLDVWAHHSHQTRANFVLEMNANAMHRSVSPLAAHILRVMLQGTRCARGGPPSPQPQQLWPLRCRRWKSALTPRWGAAPCKEKPSQKLASRHQRDNLSTAPTAVGTVLSTKPVVLRFRATSICVTGVFTNRLILVSRDTIDAADECTATFKRRVGPHVGSQMILSRQWKVSKLASVAPQ